MCIVLKGYSSGRAAICAFFFFNDTATTEIYTLSLHDALPIYPGTSLEMAEARRVRKTTKFGSTKHVYPAATMRELQAFMEEDRKSTRLNSSHANISYAVFCLKKKNTKLLPSQPSIHHPVPHLT